MNKLFFTPSASEDLLGIKKYIETELDNPVAALNTIKKIVDSLANLSDFPFSGVPLYKNIDIETEYRYIVCGNYLSFYRYNEKDKTVSVDRIIYTRRDYVEILFAKMF